MKRLLVALIMLAAFFCLPVKAEAAGKRSAFRDQLAKKEMIFIIVIPWAVCA